MTDDMQASDDVERLRRALQRIHYAVEHSLDLEQASEERQTCAHENRYELRHDREEWPANKDWWCRDCGALCEHGRVVKPAPSSDFFSGVEAVTAIRCREHVAIPKLNANAHGDAECPICATNALEADRDRLQQRLADSEKKWRETEMEMQHSAGRNTELLAELMRLKDFRKGDGIEAAYRIFEEASKRAEAAEADREALRRELDEAVQRAKDTQGGAVLVEGWLRAVIGGLTERLEKLHEFDEAAANRGPEMGCFTCWVMQTGRDARRGDTEDDFPLFDVQNENTRLIRRAEEAEALLDRMIGAYVNYREYHENDDPLYSRANETALKAARAHLAALTAAATREPS